MDKALHIYIEKKSFKNTLWQWEGLPAPVFVCSEVTSVLDTAWELLAQEALPIWGSVLAESQSSGRGQTRRQWFSPTGNVYAALRLPMQDPFLSTAAAPALSAYIIHALQGLDCHLHLKWPNDLVLLFPHAQGACKVGGILLEERQGVLMAGIGINVSHAPTDNFLRENYALCAGLLPPTQGLNDMLIPINNSEFTFKKSLAEQLWLYLVNQLYFCYKKKLPLATAWRDMAERVLLWKGQYVQLDDGHKTVHGVLQGLSNSGELVLQVHGQQQHFISGSLRLSDK